MKWQVEVAEAGEYELIVQYTCAETDLGSTLVATLGDATWTGKVVKAADPPLIGEAAL